MKVEIPSDDCGDRSGGKNRLGGNRGIREGGASWQSVNVHNPDGRDGRRKQGIVGLQDDFEQIAVRGRGRENMKQSFD